MTLSKRRSAAILIVAAAVAAMTAVYRYGGSHDAAVRITGSIEATTAELSFKIGGRVAQRPVDEGDVLKPGQLVARLEDDEILREVEVREADADAAGALLAEVKAGARVEEIAQAEAVLARVTTEHKRALDDYARSREMFSKEVIAKRDLDQAIAGRDVAAAAVSEAAERLRLLRAGSRRETKQQAAARYSAAKAALGLARVRLEQTRLLSPSGGIVMSKNIEPGEQVAAGTPVITVGDIEHLWMRGYVAETDLPRLKTGQTADVTIDGLAGRTFRGTLSFIAREAEFTPKNVQTVKERTRLVYRVKIALQNPDGILKPGMPADAVINVPP